MSDGGPADASARPGRARELTRTTVTRPQSRDTGRRHHIGAAPPVLAVLRPDGTTGHTRTAPVQLVDQTAAQLERLAARLTEQMAGAAQRLDFEAAAEFRDEVQAARRELARRDDPRP